MTHPAPVTLSAPRAEHDVVMPPELPPVALRRQLRVYAASLRRDHGSRPFLMYGQGRLGSTLLGRLLMSHPGLRFGDEVLRAPVKHPARWLDGLRAMQAPHSYGVHVKPYHLKDFQRTPDQGAWLRDRARDGWLLIHLQRRNTLLHVLSNATRQTRAGAHFTQGDGETVAPITVQVDELLHWMGLRQASQLAEARVLEGLPHLRVGYEDDLLPGAEAWARITGTVFRELGLAPHPVTTELRKVNPARLEDFVANADEVRAAVGASPWAHLLDES